MVVLRVKTLEQKLRELHGNMAAAGRHFGVTRQAVWKFVQENDSLKDVILDCREAMKDFAESALHESILDRAPWAVCFFLKCQAKDRGYIERTDDYLLQVIERLTQQIATLEAHHRPPGTNGRLAGTESPAGPLPGPG